MIKYCSWSAFNCCWRLSRLELTLWQFSKWKLRCTTVWQRSWIVVPDRFVGVDIVPSKTFVGNWCTLFKHKTSFVTIVIAVLADILHRMAPLQIYRESKTSLKEWMWKVLFTCQTHLDIHRRMQEWPHNNLNYICCKLL